MRVLRYLAVALLVPGAALAQDESGGTFLERFLERNLSGAGRDVRVTGFEGVLSSTATMQALTIADDQGVWLTLEGVTLDWSRAALLRGRLSVEALTADRIVLDRLPAGEADPGLPAPEASGFQLPELPVSVRIAQLSSPSILIGEPVFGIASDFSLEGALTLEGGDGSGTIDVRRLDGPDGTFLIDAAFSNATNVLDLDVSLQEAPGGIVATLAGLPGAPSVDLDVAGQGPLSDFEATLNLATSGEPRLAGTLVIGAENLAPEDPRPFRASLSGDVAPLFAPDYQDFFGNDVVLDVSGTRGTDGALALDRLSLAARSISLDGYLVLAPGGLPQRFDLDGRIASRDGTPVLLPIPGEATRVDGVTLTARFDADAGNTWTGAFRVEGLDRPGFSAEQLELDGGGTIDALGSGAGGFTVGLDFTAEALDLGDPAAGAALGERVTGRIELARVADEPLRIDRFDLDGETYAFESAGVLDIADRDLAIDGRARVASEDLSVFSGLAQRPLAGAAELALSGRGAILGGTFDVEVTGRTTDLSIGIPQIDNIVPGTTQLSLSAMRDLDGLTLRSLRLGSPVARLTAEGVLRSAGTRLNLSAVLDDGSLVLPGLDGRHSLSVIAEGNGEVWTVRSSLVGDTLSGSVIGEVDDRDALPGFDGSISLKAASLAPLSGPAGLPGLRGAAGLDFEGSVRGDLSVFDFRLTATGSGIATGIETIDPLLSGEADVALDAARAEGGAIELRRIDARTATLTLDGEGTVSGLPDVLVPPSPGILGGDPAPAFDGRITLRAGDLSPVAPLAGLPGLAGSASATFQGSVAADLSVFDFRLSGQEQGLSLGRSDLDRFLAGGLSLTLDAVREADGPLTLRTLSLAAPALSLNGQGTLAGLPPSLSDFDALDLGSIDFDGRLGLDARDLAPLGPLAGLPGLAGSVDATADASFSADLSRFDIRIDAEERGLTLGRGDLDAVLAGGLTSRLVATREPGQPAQLETLTVETPTIALSVDGTVSGLPDAILPLPEGAADSIVFDGRAVLDADDLSPLGPLAGLPRMGGALRGTLQGSIAADLQDFDVRLDANGANFRTGIAAADPYLAGGTVLALDVARSGDAFQIRRARFASPGLTASADGQFAGTGGDLSADVKIDNLGRIVEGFSGPATARVRASTSGSAPWRIDATVDGPGGTTLRSEGTVARAFDRVDLSVRGDVPMGLANSFIAPRSVSGRAAVDLRVSGPPALTSVSGRIATSDGRFVDTGIGLVLERIAATVSLDSGRAQIDVNAPVQSGGRISVAGPVTLSAPYSGDIRVTFDNARFRDPALYETTVSGTVTLSGPLTGGATIAGRLGLGQTELRIPSGVTGGAAPIPDIAHIAEPQPVRQTRIRAGLIDAAGNPPGSGQDAGGGPSYRLDLRIDATNQIFIRGRGLDAELGGTLRICGTTDNVIPAGQFDLVRGRLDILGRRLVLDRGSITLQGDFDPYLLLSASSEADGITVSVVIEGFLTDPDVSFVSSPELPEDEIVSRLLFGRGIENISAFQAAQLAASVATLTGRGGEGLLGSLRNSLGIDDFDVSTNDAGQAQLTFGTYISDNLYTDVQVSDGRTELDINLELTPSITVTGSTADDGDSSIGIRFERDF
jgi:translocation and assembly module TamB